MTAAVDVIGQRKMKTRIFLDPGAQASFVSSYLAERAEAQKVGRVNITIRGFGSTPETVQTDLRLFKLIGLDGKLHEITALERKNLKVSINAVPQEVVQKWQKVWHKYVTQTTARPTRERMFMYC